MCCLQCHVLFYRESKENTKKKQKPDNKDCDLSVKQTGSENSGKLEISEKKKKKRKKSSKEEMNEQSSDPSSVPHVKVVIKKTPVKAKGTKNTSSMAVEPSTSERNDPNDQNWSPNNVSKKKKKSQQLQVGSKSSKKKKQKLSLKGKKKVRVMCLANLLPIVTLLKHVQYPNSNSQGKRKLVRIIGSSNYQGCNYGFEL